MIIGRCACSLQIDPSLNGYEKNITREILLEYMHVLYTTYLHYNTLYKYFQLYNRVPLNAKFKFDFNLHYEITKYMPQVPLLQKMSNN